MSKMKTSAVCIVTSLLVNVFSNPDGVFKVGVGIADVTGPAAEIGMMGYANPSQSARGIHTRLFSRAFVFQSGSSEPVVFVSADIGMVDQGIKIKVVEKLQGKFGREKFHARNVLLSGTHTHSGPGGFMQYLLYGLTTFGFYKSSFNAIVSGMVESIEMAYANIQPGRLYISKGRVDGANINRSPTSYLANSPEERQMYSDNVDKDMTLVRIDDMNGNPLGIVNWFAVHPTSMNHSNKLISGDNKGYASMLFEYAQNPNDRPGQGKFVAAFASSNLGDVSPNTAGPRCIDTGHSCDTVSSTCGGSVTKCIAFGPGRDMEESTEIIGRKQFDVAARLFKNLGEMIKGNVNHIHQYVNMSHYKVTVRDPSTNKMVQKTTCAAALGYSFAAGTTDGPGMFSFKQEQTSGNMFWDKIRNFIKRPSQQLQNCQRPKPILLSVGESHFPYDWTASVVETQILRIGNLYIVAVPGEFTTMAGRRLRKAVEKVVKDLKQDHQTPHVVIAGLSNVYTHYITTYEEYQKQRYEAASTLYGPYTLDAYLQQYSLLAEHLFSKRKLEAGPPPQNLLQKQWSLIPPVIMDTPPLFKKFGDVLLEPVSEVRPGQTVIAKFVGGHLRNGLMRGESFLRVEYNTEGSRWKVVATDADWSTKLQWYRPKLVGSQSVIEITCKVPSNAKPGFYRIRHFGHAKPLLKSSPKSYEGKTRVFKVSGPGSNTMSHPQWNSKPNKSPNILRTISSIFRWG